MSSVSGTQDYGQFDELAEEFAARYRRGERPSVQEYVDRMPQMADEIRQMFPAMIAVEQADLDVHEHAGEKPAAHAPGVSQIGDYQILREIGRGGMGVVYEAEQISLGRRVALKVLPRHVAGDRKALERFRREAKAAARLHHTNIVPVFEVGRDGDVAFYAMQFIQGQGLDQVISELSHHQDSERNSAAVRPVLANGAAAPAATTAALTAAVCAVDAPTVPLGTIAESLLTGRLMRTGSEPTLGEVSPSPAAGLTEGLRLNATLPDCDQTIACDHSDPDPLPTSPLSGSAVLPGGTQLSEVEHSGRRMRFYRSVAQIGRQAAQGLAYAHARGIIHRDIKPSNLLLDTAGVAWITDFGLAKAEDDGLTASGDILGTVRYIPPERFRGEGDARVDIYALGLTLYELLTFRPAYTASDRLKLIEQVKTEEPPRPRSLDRRIPRDLETIVLKAIAKEAPRRYATAEALSEDLRRFLDDEPIQARQATAIERYARWARRHPAIAVLGAVLTAVLVLATTASLIVAGHMASLAEHEKNAARAERLARQDASRKAQDEARARSEAEAARAAAVAETYRASLSEARALRLGHPPGWREDALTTLAHLQTLGVAGRDPTAVRSEALACLAGLDAHEVARFEPPEVPRFGSGAPGVWTICFSPDSKTVAAATGHHGPLSLWDAESHRPMHMVPVEADRRVAVFLPDGSAVACSVGRDIVFVPTDGGARRTFLSGPGVPGAVSFDRHGRRMAVDWTDEQSKTSRTLIVYDVRTKTPLRTYDGPLDGYSYKIPMALDPEGTRVAFVGQDHAVQVLDAEGNAPPATLGTHDENVCALRFSTDGTEVATTATSGDLSVRVWNVATKRERLRLPGHTARAWGLDYSPDGNMLATCGDDATLRFWDAHTGQALLTLPLGTGVGLSASFSPDGQHVAVGTLGGINLVALEGRFERLRLAGHRDSVAALGYTPSGDRLATASVDKSLALWDTQTGRRVASWPVTFRHNVSQLAISPDGSRLAVGSYPFANDDDGHYPVRLFNAKNGKVQGDLQGHTAAVQALAFDSSGRRLATGDESGAVILWDPSRRASMRSDKHRGAVRLLQFLDGDSQLLVSTTEKIALVETSSGKVLKSVGLDGLANPSYALALNAGRLAAVGRDGSIRVFNVPSLEVAVSAKLEHKGPIAAIALTSDASLLALAGDDRRILLWNARTLRRLAALPPVDGPVRAVGFSADGRTLAICGREESSTLWNLALVRQELADRGIGWDDPADTAESTSSNASSLADGQAPSR